MMKEQEMFIPAVLYRLGLKKLAIRRAAAIGFTDPHYDEAWNLVDNQTVYPACDTCYWPLLPGEAHGHCEAAREFLASLCIADGCHENVVAEGLCQGHWDKYFKCEDCGGDLQVCGGDCVMSQLKGPAEWDLPAVFGEEPGCCADCGGDCPPLACEHGDDEDPLKGDVDPTGGYYEPPVSAHEAHRLDVMRQYGHYAG